MAGVVWYRIGVGGGRGPAPAARRGHDVGSRRQRDVRLLPTTTRAASVIVVHVAGAVATPGVVELDGGSSRHRRGRGRRRRGLPRPTSTASTSRRRSPTGSASWCSVSVTRRPRRRDGASGARVRLVAGDSGTTAGLLNLNTATSTQLEALPGIGPALAAAIIDERERRGGFRSVQELRDVRGIGEKRFADLADHVTV